MAKKDKKASKAAPDVRRTYDSPRIHPCALFEHVDGAESDRTGRFLVTTVEDSAAATKAALRDLKRRIGVKDIASSRDGGAPSMPEGADVLVLQSLGVFVVNVDPERATRLGRSVGRDADVQDTGYVVEPEYYCRHAIPRHPGVPIGPFADRDDPMVSASPDSTKEAYWHGFRDALNRQSDEPLIHEPPVESRGFDPFAEPPVARGFEPPPQVRRSGVRATWGMQAMRVTDSPYRGRGVRVAVIDSGIDEAHSDFQNRIADTTSFVGVSAQDDHGHGTHCAGTLGASEIEDHHYGVASEVVFFIAKVLDRYGWGKEAHVIAGIEWAINQGCRVISVSIERGVNQCQSGYSVAYEATGERALAKNAIVIAAAGNRSRRSVQLHRPVSAPANTPSIVGVGAIDRYGHVADFSNRTFCKHGYVDFVGPGVDVFSSDLTNSGYGRRDGTSMATPHVSGLAALFFEKDPGLDGYGVYKSLKRSCLFTSGLDAADYGHGLPRAV